MSDDYGDVCADKWTRAYNGDGRCATCGSPVKHAARDAEAGRDEEQEP